MIHETYIWASPRARQHHSVPFNTDQKFITFILLPNSDVFYKSKRGTHGEPSSLKPARKEVNYTSLGSGGLLASWWAGSINAHCFPFGFLLGGESSWILGRRKEKIHGSLITADFSSVSTIVFDILIFPPFLLLFFLAGFLPSEPFDKACISKLQQDPRRRNSAHDLGIPNYRTWVISL